MAATVMLAAFFASGVAASPLTNDGGDDASATDGLIKEEFFDLPESVPKFAIKSNMLYDVLLVPNIGIEVPIGNRWSVAADWQYGWWKTDRTHDYWRIYGGGIEGRYWLGDRADYKRLAGHHISLYAQALTYDFEFGGRGRMGGKPKGTLWDKASLGIGIGYGYAHSFSRHFKIDFSIGIGYLGGEYQSIIPTEDATYTMRQNISIISDRHALKCRLYGCPVLRNQRKEATNDSFLSHHNPACRGIARALVV